MGRTVRTEVFDDLNSGESRARVVPQPWGGAAGAAVVLEQRYRDNGEDATYRIRIRITAQ